jgi:hypothetical protein
MDGFAWRVSYRLGTGSKALGAWCWQHSALGTLAAAGTVAALPVYEPASTLVIPAFAWGVAAWAKGAPAADPEQAEDDPDEPGCDGPDDEYDADESDDEESGEKPAPRDPQEAMRDYVEHAVAANRHFRNRQGVHIRELLEGLQHHGSLTTWKTADFRRHLETLEIPVRDNLKIIIDGKETNRPGVHHDDLTRSLGRSPALPPHLVPELTPQ